MKKTIILLFASLLSIAALATENKVAVVISKTSYDARSSEVTPAAKSWTAACNLAGLPYSTLFVEDLNDEVLAKHNVVVFCQCAFLTNAEYAMVQDFVSKINGTKYGVVVDGLLGQYDQAEDIREKLPVNDLLGIKYIDHKTMDGFRLKVSDDDHYITRDYRENAYLSNLLSSQMPVLTLGEGSEVLVSVSNDVDTYPYETVSSRNGFNVAVLDGVSNSASIGASFKNYAPKGFFPSEFYPLLRKTLQWCVTGNSCEPFPGLLLSDGGMTALIRVDGDGSQAQASMVECMTYLEDIAKESGVQGVMTYVSAWATRAGWHFYAPHSKALQELGTSIGTHSMNHRLSELKAPEEFSLELDGSKEEIREGNKACGYDPGEIRYLVNPGNTLAMNHYDEVASRFDFFMSHGHDQSLPVCYGNLTWFTGGKQLAMVDDSPSPDYQWFYDTSWSHTTPEVANYENLVLEHLFNTVGNGVVFDAMWHDYGMSKMLIGEPRNVTKVIREGTRIINDNNQEYYETVRNFWNTHDVYCPEVPEFIGKMNLLSDASIDWKVEDGALVADIAFSDEDFVQYGQYVGGMALAVNNSSKPIASVQINGKPWLAFSCDKVILPSGCGQNVNVKVCFGCEKPAGRVIYTSKLLKDVCAEGDCISATVEAKSMARVKFETAKPSVVIGASRYSAQNGGTLLEARAMGGGTVKAVPNPTKVKIYSATLPIKDFKVVGEGVQLTVEGNGCHHNTIVVTSPELGRKAKIDIAELTGTKKITIK